MSTYCLQRFLYQSYRHFFVLWLLLVAHYITTIFIWDPRTYLVSELFDYSYNYNITHRPTATSIPKILVWNQYYHLDMRSRMAAKVCEYPCEYGDRISMPEDDADAIFFHVREMRVHPSQLPRRRNPAQIYIAFERESPHHPALSLTGDKALPHDYFNVTMDYRINENTYFWGYGRLVPAITDIQKERINAVSDQEFDEIYSKKQYLGLAMISNCRLQPSKRETYLEVLSDYMRITFVGNCFPNQQHRAHCAKMASDVCEQSLLDIHFFFFAFENSVCQDYVTEKFFRLDRNIVPIVLRRRIYQGIAPSSAFVAADDFESPQALAEYLQKVANDKELYKSYFSWRNTHIMFDRSIGICDFCRDLTLGQVRVRRNFNIVEYYSEDECEMSAGITLLNNTVSEKSEI